MPLPIAIPPWLKPQNPVEDYMGGMRVGAQLGEQQASIAARAQAQQAQIAIAQQRLQQQQQISEMELQANQKIAEQKALREQQKMQIDAAYQNERLNLEKGRLDETAKANELKSQLAAKRLQAQQAYSQAIAGGMDPAQAAFQFGAAAGLPGGAMTEAMRERRPEIPPSARVIQDPSGEKAWLVQAGGKTSFHPIKSEGDQMSKRESARLAVLKAEMKGIEGSPWWALGTAGKISDDKAKKAFDTMLKRHQDIQAEIDQIAPPKSSGAAAPAKKAPHAEGTYLRGKDGRVYVVKNGQPVALGPGEEPAPEGGDEEE